MADRSIHVVRLFLVNDFAIDKSAEYCKEYNPNIKPDRPMLNIPNIVLNAAFNRRVAPVAMHLRPASDAGTDQMLEHIKRDGLFKLFDEMRDFRPRTNKTHVPFKYVEKLW